MKCQHVGRGLPTLLKTMFVRGFLVMTNRKIKLKKSEKILVPDPFQRGLPPPESICQHYFLNGILGYLYR